MDLKITENMGVLGLKKKKKKKKKKRLGGFRAGVGDAFRDIYCY